MRLSDLIKSEEREKNGDTPSEKGRDPAVSLPSGQMGFRAEQLDNQSQKGDSDVKKPDEPQKSSFKLSNVSSVPPQRRPEREPARTGHESSPKVMLGNFMAPEGKKVSSSRPSCLDYGASPKKSASGAAGSAETGREKKSAFKLSSFIERNDIIPEQDLTHSVPEHEHVVSEPPAPDGSDEKAADSESDKRAAGLSFTELLSGSDSFPESPALDSPPVAELDKSVPEPDEQDAMFGVAVYDDEPVGIYEAAKQLGIDVPESRTKLIRNARSCLSLVFKRVLEVYAEKNMVWPMIKSIATDIEGIVQHDGNILSIIQRHRVQEEKLLWHSIYTAILAMDLAVHTKCSLEASIQDIGGAALLHDIGLLAISGSMNAVNDENHPRFREHVATGVDFAREAGVPECIVTMIQQHHERIDGLGFPEGIKGDKLLNCSQILGVSNVFEHAVIDVSAENENRHEEQNGLSHVFAEYRKAFDNQLLKEMIALIGYYPVGSVVELSNRSVCEVLRQNEGMPLRPVVKVIVDGNGRHPETTKTINLKQVNILSVTRAIGSIGHDKR